MLRPMLRAAAIAALATTPAFAQGFLPLGNQIMDGSQNLVTVNLGFNFTMPGGNIVTSVDVDETGRIFEVGIDTSDASESTAEMIANPGGSINVCWDTVTYSAVDNSSVWFDTDNLSVATITWVNVNTPSNTTFQVQLDAGGTITMCYDSRTPTDDGIIGLCPGNGATLPAADDLSTAIGNVIVGTDPTIFEDFGSVDWTSAAFLYVPTIPGGATGWTVVGIGGIADPITPFSRVEDAGTSGCPVSLPFIPTSYFFTPNGLGDYDITSSASLFDPTIGPSLGFTSDDGKQLDFNLGFMFPWPSGADTLIDIDPNGRILPSNSTDFGDFNPTIAEHTGAEAIAVWWHDFNVNEPGSGNVHLITNPGVSATITWNGVHQFDTTNSVSGQTVQVTMFLNGTFIITHQDVNQFNSPIIGAGSDDLLVGFSNGSGVDPGEIDLTALPINVPIGVNYEWWDSSGSTPAEPTDLVGAALAPYGGELVSLSNPIINTTWSAQIQNSGGSQFGLYLVGTTQVTTDMSIFGSPCDLLIDGPLILTTVADGLGGQLQWNLPIPNDPNLFGVELFIQGAVDGAPQPPFSSFAGLPWMFSFTNALKGTVGGI